MDDNRLPDREAEERRDAEPYESPEVEEIDTEANPAVTAAGGTATDGVG